MVQRWAWSFWCMVSLVWANTFSFSCRSGLHTVYTCEKLYKTDHMRSCGLYGLGRECCIWAAVLPPQGQSRTRKGLWRAYRERQLEHITLMVPKERDLLKCYTGGHNIMADLCSNDLHAGRSFILYITSCCQIGIRCRIPNFIEHIIEAHQIDLRLCTVL